MIMWPFTKDKHQEIDPFTHETWLVEGESNNYVLLINKRPQFRAVTLGDAEMLLAHHLEMIQVVFEPTWDAWAFLCRKRDGYDLSFTESKE